MRPITVVGVALTSVVVEIVAAGIVVHDIVVLFHCIWVTPPWGTLWFLLLPCRGSTTCYLSPIDSCVSPSLLIVGLEPLVSSHVSSICAAWPFSPSGPLFGCILVWLMWLVLLLCWDINCSWGFVWRKLYLLSYVRGVGGGGVYVKGIEKWRKWPTQDWRK